MNPFQSMTYRGCANPKKDRFVPKGKYGYDVFYELDGESMVGFTKGNNKAHVRQNFYIEYDLNAKIKNIQRL